MKYQLRFGFLLLFILSFRPQVSNAQNIAFVNSAEILAELPAAKQADAELEALQKQMQLRGENMVEQFQSDVATLEQKVGAGELSPQQQEQEAKKLEERREEIMKFEQDMVNQIQTKRTDLLRPIFDNVNQAIEAVRKENNYQMIFDQTVILTAEEYLNVTELVKRKLGL